MPGVNTSPVCRALPSQSRPFPSLSLKPQLPSCWRSKVNSYHWPLIAHGHLGGLNLYTCFWYPTATAPSLSYAIAAAGPIGSQLRNQRNPASTVRTNPPWRSSITHVNLSLAHATALHTQQHKHQHRLTFTDIWGQRGPSTKLREKWFLEGKTLQISELL